MNINNLFRTLVSISLAIMLSACSTTSSQTTPNGAPLIVPSLQVKFDCGACKVKGNIASLIVDGYNKAATDAGAKISSKAKAIMTVNEYVSRGDTERLLVGAFAGKDEIKASITYKGKRYFVEDYYRNAWLGVDVLAKKIGELTFEEINKDV